MAGSKPGVSKRKGNKGASCPASIRELQRDNEALTMRANGVNLRDIADHFGLDHPMQAARMVDRAMARVPRENATKMRRRWDDRLEQAALRAEEIMHEDHYAVSNGKVVELNGQPVYDRMPNVAAMKALVDVGKRVAALGGLDAPTRRSVEVVTQSAVEREIARLERELGANDRSAASQDQEAS